MAAGVSLANTIDAIAFQKRDGNDIYAFRISATQEEEAKIAEYGDLVGSNQMFDCAVRSTSALASAGERFDEFETTRSPHGAVVNLREFGAGQDGVRAGGVQNTVAVAEVSVETAEAKPRDFRSISLRRRATEKRDGE